MQGKLDCFLSIVLFFVYFNLPKTNWQKSCIQDSFYSDETSLFGCFDFLAFPVSVGAVQINVHKIRKIPLN